MEEAKWFTVMIGLAFMALFLGMGFSMAAEHEAKAEVMVACFKAGNTDCDTIVKRAFK